MLASSAWLLIRWQINRVSWVAVGVPQSIACRQNVTSVYVVQWLRSEDVRQRHLLDVFASDISADYQYLLKNLVNSILNHNLDPIPWMPGHRGGICLGGTCPGGGDCPAFQPYLPVLFSSQSTRERTGHRRESDIISIIISVIKTSIKSKGPGYGDWGIGFASFFFTFKHGRQGKLNVRI